MSAERLDRVLVARGLAPSRARAQALIAAGAVRLGGRVATKPAAMVAPDAPIELGEDPCPWVSRAGLKLDHALDAFALVPAGMALDLGASTGGFTEVLLARGAAHVHAVDVGHGQLSPKLAGDPRVTLHEGVNARALGAAGLPPVDWITADLSFISLTLALPPALELARAGAHLAALVKPQFEAGRAAIGKGGVVRDAAVHAEVCARIRGFLEDRGWAVLGLTESPIRGGDGNTEFLIAARRAP
ncbi:TlyA family rRNA (cytidine-2'-O)-methyltransferase [Paralimibaculum aggregatum]|uniref:TlyA family rRNA (Cytidine-2'-O)-methyltransferase n=1 Tax=Paralimibaculum aggregatum TaxID=3036245 RepID=A0ABQ6LGT2_9RHOB|nr:TlyA family RNA methyltransferase [Limibaculum sp. NKW23]GMG82504.1 TlyA family rRNA (cytidine-2'-O)-methyltransferase [Limibaculum sp. NKW23]